jgi:hypothetical protein
MRNITETVKQLLIINVLFFIGTLAVGDQAYDFTNCIFLKIVVSIMASITHTCLCMEVYAYFF